MVSNDKTMISTAKFKHFDEFVSHEEEIFLDFCSYLHSCATRMIFSDNLIIIIIYVRMILFFDEN